MKNTGCRLKAILLCAVLVLGCAACGQTPPSTDAPTPTPVPTVAPVQPTPSPAPPISREARAQERYSVAIPSSDDRMTFDGNGDIAPPEQQFELLRDVLTDEPKYKQYSRAEDTGEDDKGGDPIIRYLCALYDMEDKLVYDWSEYGYRDPFGDFILKMDSEYIRSWAVMDGDPGRYCVLWNMKTGKEVVDRAARVQMIDDSSLLLKPPLYDSPTLGIMDMSGAEPVFRPFPEGYGDVQPWNGYLIVDVDIEDDDSEVVKGALMTKDYKVLLERDGLDNAYFTRNGLYLSYNNGEEHGIMSPDGKPVYTLSREEHCEYFDGVLVLISQLKIDGTEREWTRRLAKADGTMLADGYSQLEALDNSRFDTDTPAERFLGVRGETAELLDRNGKVIAAQTIPNLNYVREAADGIYIFSVLMDGGGSSEDNGEQELCGLLGANLEILLPPSQYTDIYEISGTGEDDVNRAFDLLRCTKPVSGGLNRTDILDTTGKLLIENLTGNGDAGPDRIAVVKGFSAGVMDFSGNWIGKRSIFNKVEDEKGRFY